MNENIQSKRYLLKELESLLSNANNSTDAVREDLTMYCEYMKSLYLSCSTNN